MPQPQYAGPIYEFATLRVYHHLDQHPDTFIFHNLTSSWEPETLEPEKDTWIKEDFSILNALRKLSLEGWQVVHVKEWQPHPGDEICEVWLQRVVRFFAPGSAPQQRRRRDRKLKEL